MSNNKDIKELAKSLGLEEVDTEVAVKDIARDILFTMHRDAVKVKNKSMQKKIESLYSEWYPRGVFHDDETPISSILLIGPPGQGKTTAFKVAGKLVADGLGMNYLENGQIDEKIEAGGIDDNDFLFITQETAGVISAIEWAGLPTAKVQGKDSAGNDVKVMGRLYSPRLAAIRNSGGSVLLLDDFMNAAPSIQNVGLSLTEEKRYGDLSLTSAYIGLTGNMGSIDGTHTTKVSSAIRNRCQPFFTQDIIHNYVKRVQQDPRYRDEVGDVGVTGFLERFSQYFASLPNPKEMGGYNTPRSWDKALADFRRAVYSVGGRKYATAALPEIRRKAASYLGHEVAHQYSTYLRSMMDMADPLARQLILEGKLDQDALKKKFDEGYSANEQDFAYQYSLALAEYTAIKVTEDKGKLKEAVERFAIGMTALDGASFVFGINAFKSKLASTHESLSEKSLDGTRDLTQKVKIEIGKIIAASPDCTQEQCDDMIDALSNSDKLGVKGPRRSTRRKRK